MDGAVVRFGLGYDDGDDKRSAEINVSRNGVSLSGNWPVYNAKEPLEEIKATLDEAFDLYLRMTSDYSDPHDVAKAFVATINE